MNKRQVLRERLFCDENIFLAIYSVESYIQNKELLSFEDRNELIKLKDKFNEEIINSYITKVREEIEKIIDNDKYFSTRVYFKPKKFKNNKIIFRPIHSANLISQIAMVAMLNVIIYDIDDKNSIMPSNLSKLIPPNFYGNRIAFKPENLFKPWQEQYKLYNSIANEKYRKYHDNLEYKWEISLDLENFFPTINPISLINYINDFLPVTYSDEDKEFFNLVLQKLIFIELEDTSEDDLKKYINNEEIKNIDCKFALGLPQGLPQSCFFANIFMVGIEKIFKKHIKGKMLFYVDDSTIFTNDISDVDSFSKKIKDINDDIKKYIEELYKRTDIKINNNLKGFVNDFNVHFKINIHPPGEKSTLSNIQDSKEGEIYIHCIGREVSKTAFEINTSFSDEDSKILFNKTNAILEALEKEIDDLEIKIKNLEEELKNNENKNEDSSLALKLEELKNCNSYKKKLIRYKKFFKYRNKTLNFRENADVSKLERELKEDLQFLGEEVKTEDLKIFFEKYNDDILGTNIGIVLKAMEEENKDYKDIIDKIELLNEKLFGSKNNKSSYLYQVYSKYLDDDKNKILKTEITKYDKLSEIIKYKLRYLKNKSDTVYREKALEMLNNIDYESIVKEYIGEDFYKKASLVLSNSTTLQRMILNAIFSYILKVEISDSAILQKTNNRKITYFELRLLELLRNKRFKFKHFNDLRDSLINEEFNNSIDYSIMQVLAIFKINVRNPLYIDNLILVHKYTCDIWKNGSKYLYFYTLHNQEHAIELIQSSVKILRAIDYMNISANDYYVLFIACYLHDISMVTLPDLDALQRDNEDTNLIYSNFIKDISKNEKLVNKKDVLKLLKDYYIKIDSFYEGLVRNNHANDSAYEIRNRKDIYFIDSSLREIVAEIAQAHGQDVRDIYRVKSEGTVRLWDTKFTKIVLRIADLLDMSNYRISKPILEHNLENMNKTSRFHWLSHLITSNCEIETKYILNDNGTKNFLKKGGIYENITLVVKVNISQLTSEKSNSCSDMSLVNLDDKSIEIKCGEKCSGTRCNFLCKWFSKKNNWLFKELAALQEYLNGLQDNYFKTNVKIRIEYEKKNFLTAEQFAYLKEYLEE